MQLESGSAPVFSTRPSILDREFDNLAVTMEDETLWCTLLPQAPSRWSWSLLGEMQDVRDYLEDWPVNDSRPAPAFHIIRSRIPGVFSLGGDLTTFLSLIAANDKNGLRNYAHSCVELVHATNCGFSSDITTIALVEGAAYGGGFEAALSAQIIVAEESSTFGFPELLFGLFPGMGALPLLSQRIPETKAFKLIESARTYSAAELHDIGIIDTVVPDGEGVSAVKDLARRRLRHSSGYRALRRASYETQFTRLDAMLRVADLWVNAALDLSPTNISVMRKIASAQDRRQEQAA